MTPEQQNLEQAVKALMEKYGAQIDFEGLDARNFKKGKQLTYGEARQIKSSIPLFGMFTDFESSASRAKRILWEAFVTDGEYPFLILDYGSFRLDVDFRDFGSDDELFCEQNESYMLELFLAIPKSK